MQHDTQIIHAIKQGNSAAFARLVERYKKAVYGIILPKVRDFHQAQDLAQETFVSAYLSLESLKEPEKVGPWLCGIARNLTDKWLSREKRDDLSFEQLLEKTHGSESNLRPLRTNSAGKVPGELAEHAQLHQLLWCCLYVLPDISQEILILSYIREMKPLEIAQFLGISPTAVRTRLSDARKRLKKEIIRMVENTVQNQPMAENFTDKVVAEAVKRGEQYLADGHWKEARKQFQRAADVQGDYAPAYRGLGMVAKGMIDVQYYPVHGKVDPRLIDEACNELTRAYRLGMRDSETVWTLADLYLQFHRCEEYVNLLWDYAQTADDPKEAFKAGCKSTHEMQDPCMADYERSIRSQRALVEKFSGKVTLTDELFSYVHVTRAYRYTGRIDEWFAQTKRLAEKIGDDMRLETYYHYMRDCAFEFRYVKRYQEAIEAAEAFIRWALESKHRNPRTKWMIIDVQAMVLLRIYHAIAEAQKINEVLADAGETLRKYPGEWEAAMANISDESEATHERLEAMYHEVVLYPESTNTVAEIRGWLDDIYASSIGAAVDNLGSICGQIGRGADVLDLFIPFAREIDKRGQRISGLVNTRLAALMLNVRNDRDASLEYLKRATADYGKKTISQRFGPHFLKRSFENDDAFESVRNDPEFLEVVNAPVINQ